MRAEVFARKPDWITFTSSSTVKNFVAAAGRAALDGVQHRVDWSDDVGDGAGAGPDSRRRGGDPHTIPALVEALKALKGTDDILSRAMSL